MSHPSKCALCGHPDYRHRITDAIEERLETGEDEAVVLADYGWTRTEYEQVKAEVEAAG
jgi:hypothetical protein